MSCKAYSAGLSALALSVTLAGCVTSRPVGLPNGAQGLAVDCSQMGADIADCMNYAAKKCGGPYRILARENYSSANEDTTSPGTLLIPDSRARLLIVQCGKDDAPAESAAPK